MTFLGLSSSSVGVSILAIVINQVPLRLPSPHQLSGVESGLYGSSTLGLGHQVFIVVDNNAFPVASDSRPIFVVANHSIVLRARCIPGCLIVVGDCLSWQDCLVNTEWSL